MPALHSLTDTKPDEALKLYLRERSTEVTENTLQSHEYRLNHFVRWCNEVAEIENVNNLTGRDLHRYKLWRQEDGDLNQVSLKSQMDTLRVFLRFCASIDAVEPDLHSKVMSPTLSDGIGQRDVKLDEHGGDDEEIVPIHVRRSGEEWVATVAVSDFDYEGCGSRKWGAVRDLVKTVDERAERFGF